MNTGLHTAQSLPTRDLESIKNKVVLAHRRQEADSALRKHHQEVAMCSGFEGSIGVSWREKISEESTLLEMKQHK